MYADLFPGETEAALAQRAANPVPRVPRPPSIWAGAADLLAAPFTGAAQGINETLRLVNRVASARPTQSGGPAAGLLPWTEEPASIRQQREFSRTQNAEISEASDQALRRGADYWKPDPMTSNWASQFLHETGRVLSKVAGYSLVGGMAGAVVGTSADEGGTAYLGMRDRGVDPATAAKVGAVHAGMTGISIALPIAGKTIAQTAGLVLASGPASFMAEAALSRKILETASYPELAAEFDPFDTTGLLLSLAPGAVMGAATHVMKRGAAARPADVPPEVRAGELAPDAVEAAHVVYQRDVMESGQLGRADDPQARVAHAQALDEARAALDEGRPMQARELHADEVRTAAVLDEIAARMRAADALPVIVAERAADAGRLPLDSLPVQRDGVGALQPDPMPAVTQAAARTPAETRPQLQRALEIARERPDMPVRMEDDGSPAQQASDLIGREAQAAGRDAAESTRAVQAAIECFLKLGTE